jgi:hypothetical protein
MVSFFFFPIITPFSPRCGSVKLLAVTARFRFAPSRRGRSHSSATSSALLAVTARFRFASSRCGLSPYRQNRLRLKENKFSSAAAGFLYTARSLIKVELVEPLVHCLIAEADHLIFLQDVFFCSSVLAADTAVNTCFLIVKHINVQIS